MVCPSSHLGTHSSSHLASCSSQLTGWACWHFGCQMRTRHIWFSTPCPALPCPALPSLALPCPALPCHNCRQDCLAPRLTEPGYFPRGWDRFRPTWLGLGRRVADQHPLRACLGHPNWAGDHVHIDWAIEGLYIRAHVAAEGRSLAELLLPWSSPRI